MLPAFPVQTSAESVSENLLLGDLNDDGKINAKDLTLLKRDLLESSVSRHDLYRADTDANGIVNKEDVSAVQQYLLGNSDFPAVTEMRSFRYAIDMTWEKGVTESTNAGFLETAYVNLDNCIGSWLEWQVDVPIDGNYMCAFGIANGSNVNRKMKIETGGEDFWMLDFPPTGAWTSWEECRIVLPLSAGANRIRMISATEQGGPNFDYLKTQWTDEPYAETADEEQSHTPPVPASGTRTIYLAGDSTVVTYGKNRAPQQGWGAHLGSFLPNGNVISNHAAAGRSAKSFIDQKRLKTILDVIQSGDYLMVQFGINDGAFTMKDRYCPTCGKVPGTSGSFEWYMAQYIEGAKAKGAYPIIVTVPIHLDSRKDGKFVPVYTNYLNAAKQLAAYYEIPCIDLNTMMVEHYNAIGYDAAFKYHMCSAGKNDVTHFTEAGAQTIAKLIADEMKRQNLV